MSLLYDPMGWFQPLLIPVKTLVKTLWELKKGWDSEIPQNLLLTAQTTLTELQHCSGVKCPRQLFTILFNTQFLQLHMFVDALNTAYAAVTYMRLVDHSSKQIQVQFLIGKARITLSRPMTIPKLELLAVLIG